MNATALILAAGEGTRMKSDTPKVAHEVLGVPMIRLVVDSARAAGCGRVVAITGHRADVVEALVPEVECVRQERQLGTGHAVMCAREALRETSGSVVILSGDVPLLRSQTIRELIDARESSGAACSLLTVVFEDPSGYGRIIREADDSVAAIIEHKDLPARHLGVAECNAGVYCFDSRLLFEMLDDIEPANAQGEYYLTDVIGLLRARGESVVALVASDASESLGVNSRSQLAQATKELQRRVNGAWMAQGVTMTDPDLVWIDPRAKLGRDVTLLPMTFIMGASSVGDRSIVGPGTRVTDSSIGQDAVVDASVLLGATVGARATVGPVSYLRPGAILEAGSKVGAAVEIKNSVVGEGSKVPHLSYIGDATIGRDANLGAGTITCNYDGTSKHRTVIGDGAFIGSDTMLIAPVEIGAGAITGAGSAISREVPPDSLGIERSEQRIVDGWAARKRGKTVQD